MIEYWLIESPPLRKYTPEEIEASVAEMIKRLDRFRREVRTRQIIDYCRHQDSPAWRAKVADIYERHPEWR